MKTTLCHLLSSLLAGFARSVAVALLITLAVGHAGATEPADVEADPAAADQPPPIPDSRRTPRATMKTFLKAMNAAKAGDIEQLDEAAQTLDLSDISPLVASEKGRELAWTLMNVIERADLAAQVKRISQREQGKPYDVSRFDSGSIRLTYDESKGWLFSKTTLASLPEIIDELDDLATEAGTATSADDAGDEYLPLSLRIRQSLPANLKSKSLALEQWQWLGILATILLGFILDKLVSLLLLVAVRSWRNRVATGAYRNVDDAILRPFGLMAMAMAWWAGLIVLGLPGNVLVVLLVSVKFLTCLSAVWGAYRLVDLLQAFLVDKAHLTDSKLDDALVPLLTKTVKVFVTLMGIVFVAENLDVDVTSLLAGLGLGGLAFALAAKDVAGNLFGSVTVLLDQTFHVGDWVVIGDVEGTVERIGFRSTRIRTFYNSLVSMPNSRLITESVDNMGRREYRRLSCKLSIAYDTPPERVEAFCEGIREIVRLHPYMRKDNFHVYLNDLGAASLNILVYVFWKTPNWATELRERHRFLLDCLRLAKRLGVEYAFPTQTLHMIQAEAGPPMPESGAFVPDITPADARHHGRDQAREIVQQTTGLDVVPPPVILGENMASDDSG